MDDSTGRGHSALIEGDTEFDARDATLLRAINRTGSIAKAATELGRSRAHALNRIETLEVAFGSLVERQRGGYGGGGSRLTDTGMDVLDRFERLASVLATTATVPETVLSGTVSGIDGELADVDTEIGRLLGIHDGVEVGVAVQVRIGADAITLHDVQSDVATNATSARNRQRGTVVSIDPGETVRTVRIRVDDVEFEALVTEHSASALDLRAGTDVIATWKATATKLIPETVRG